MARTADAEEGKWDRVEAILGAVNGRWAVRILRHLAMGVSRPADLLAAINETADPQLSRKIMFEALDRLRTSGLIVRSEVSSRPLRTLYSLTDEGHRIVTELSKLGEDAVDLADHRRPLVRADRDDYSQAMSFDTSTAHPARVWNFLLGGKDNYEADREAGRAVINNLPAMPLIARETRRFQGDAVSRLTGLGVRQFLDLGTGLPVAGAVHEVAQRAAPESRVVYVDNDPMVLAHARALLTSSPEGACDYIQSDIREAEEILAAAARTLDMSRPVAVLFVAVLHFLADEENPWQLVGRFLDGIPADRYLVVVHGASDIQAGRISDVRREYNARSRVAYHPRARAEVARFFEGVEFIGPGAVPLRDWFPEVEGDDPGVDLAAYAAMGWQSAAAHGSIRRRDDRRDGGQAPV